MADRYELWIPALVDRVLRKSGVGTVAWLGGQWREHVAERVRYFLPTRTPLPSLGWRVTTRANLLSGVHPDAENIHKAIVDGLVARRGKSSSGTGFFAEDKNLAGAFCPVTHTDDAQGVLVTIERVA